MCKDLLMVWTWEVSFQDLFGKFKSRMWCHSNIQKCCRGGSEIVIERRDGIQSLALGQLHQPFWLNMGVTIPIRYWDTCLEFSRMAHRGTLIRLMEAKWWLMFRRAGSKDTQRSERNASVTMKQNGGKLKPEGDCGVREFPFLLKFKTEYYKTL